MQHDNQQPTLSQLKPLADFRAAFPFFKHNPQSVYLDNAATTQKPACFIKATEDYYSSFNANVHRASHNIAQHATSAFEHSRQTVQQFINAEHAAEIIWTQGATDSINIVCNIIQSYQDGYFNAGDEIIITQLEHHANFVPWQQLSQKLHLTLTVLPLTDNYCEALSNAISPKTKLVAFTHISNALGTVLPIEKLVKLAKQHNALTLIDGAQAIAHVPIDVKQIGCDFYVFSAHKVYGPTGLGVLYGKRTILNACRPVQFGGEMVNTVSNEQTCFADLPYKFEAGTPNIAAVIAFSAVIKFVSKNRIERQLAEALLTQYTIEQLLKRPLIKLISPTDAIGSISFTINDWHNQDAAEILSQMGIACRVGSHCAQPLMQALNLVNGTIRISIAAYTTLDDINAFFNALDKLDDF